jgi:hypothetical protein
MDGKAACDAELNQVPPIKAWGHEYAAVRYRTRSLTGVEEDALWRLVGAVDGTALSYDPAPPANAPSTLGSGQVAVIRSAQPFVVSSQDADHPFYMAGYMTGGAPFEPVASGDPEMLNVVPSDQYLDSYTFFSDITYANTNVVVIRGRHAGAFKDVVLDCAGTLDGWTPIGSKGKYEYTRVDLNRDFKPTVYPGGTCNSGRSEIHSQGPFGITVWGFDFYASYGYEGGSGLRTLNNVTVSTTVR